MKGLNREWLDIEVIPRRIYSAYYDDCPAISGDLYDVVESDDAANAVIGVDRENGYRFILHVGVDGIDVEIRRAGGSSSTGTLIKSNRKVVYYI